MAAAKSRIRPSKSMVSIALLQHPAAKHWPRLLKSSYKTNKQLYNIYTTRRGESWSLLCFAVFCVLLSFAIISLGERELVALRFNVI